MKKNKYNLAVIGAGPSGMICAGRAAELGAKTVLLEKNNSLGIKLLITGNGRCNITNAEDNFKKFIEAYGNNGKFLFSAFNKFSNKDIIDFFESRGIETKIENNGKVFPVSDKAKDVVACLEKYLEDNKVDVKFESSVQEIIVKKRKIEKIILIGGREIMADNFVIATGGKSYPLSGSSGDAYKWLKKMGHNVIEPKPTLVPVVVWEEFVKDIEGVSLKNIGVSLWNNKKINSQIGDLIFTSNGLSGPVILNLSRIINREKINNFKIKIDFKPETDMASLDKIFLDDFLEQGNKTIKTYLNKIFPQRLIPIILKEVGILENKKISEIKKDERKKIIKFTKEFELKIKGLLGFDKAIVSCGGVSLKEVDPKTMKSKIIDNLYLVGEILDIDGPTGGYNLQIAWSTGYLAGENIK